MMSAVEVKIPLRSELAEQDQVWNGEATPSSDPSSTVSRFMLPDTSKLLRDPGSELVFGLVAPVGADLEALEADLSNQLRQYGYTPSPIRLSQLLRGVRDLNIELKNAPEFDRLMSYMDGGNRLREKSGSGEILALWAMALIKKQRAKDNPVRRRTAHILRSIKHPDEARALRAVYGPGFFLIGLSASKAQKRMRPGEDAWRAARA